MSHEEETVAPFGRDSRARIEEARLSGGVGPPSLPAREEIEEPEVEVEGRNGRRGGQARRANEPLNACPGCGRALNNESRIKAFRVLGSAGETFAKEVKTSYVTAIENFVSSVAQNLDVLVDARLVRAESTMKVIMEAAMAIHAPKVESKDDKDPIKRICEFLNIADDEPVEEIEEE